MTRNSEDVIPVIRPVRPEPAPPRAAARRARRSVRVLLAVLVLLGGAYASLPWWLPTNFIRSRIAAELRRATGCDAAVGRCDASWRDGVVLGDISVSDPTIGTSPLITVKEVRADFSPIRLLFGLGLSTLEVISPAVRADIDTHGRLSLARLKLQGGDPPPVRDVIIRNARVEVNDARSGERTDLDLADVQLGLDRSTGRLDVRIAGDLIREIRTAVGGRQRSSTPFGTEAALILPTLATGGRAATDLSGEGRLHWKEIDLSSLPIQLLPGMAGARLSGRCGGEIRASIGRQLDQSLAVSLDVADVSFARGQADAVQFAEASIKAAGRWRPTYDVLELSNWNIRLPGIEVHGQAVETSGKSPSDSQSDPVMVWSLRGTQALRAAIAGRIDVQKLARAVNSKWLAASRGALGFDGRIEVGREKTVWSARFNGDGFETASGGPVRLSASEPLTVSLRGVDDTSGDFVVVEEFSATLGESHIRGSGGFPSGGARYASSESWLMKWFEKGWLDLTVECGDLAHARNRVAALRDSPKPVEIGGTGRASVWVGATPRGRVARLSIDLGEAAKLFIPGLIEKPAGTPLRLDFTSRYGDVLGSLIDLRIAASGGTGRIETLSDEKSYLQFAVHRESVIDGTTAPDVAASNASFSIDIAAAIGLHIIGVEHWCAMLPVLQSAIDGANATNRPRVSGDLSTHLFANLRHRATAGAIWPELYRISAAIDGDRLAVHAGPGFEKPAGELARANLQYWFDRGRARNPHRVQSTFEVDGGGCNVRAGLGGGAVEFDASLDVTDIVRLARHADWLDRLVTSYGMIGAADGRLRYAESPEGGERTFSLDLTSLGIGGNTLRRPTGSAADAVFSKRPGMPCKLDASFRLARPHLDGLTSGDPGMLRWDVQRLQAVVGASEIVAPRGSVLFDQQFESRVLKALAEGRPESLIAADADWHARLSADANLVADDDVRFLTTRLMRGSNALSIDGGCRAVIEIDATPRALTLAGHADGSGLGITVMESLAKQRGSPAKLTWDLELHAADTNAANEPITGLVVRDLSIVAAGGRLSAEGEAGLCLRSGCNARPAPWLRSAILDATCEWSDLSRLFGDREHVFPGGWRAGHVSGGISGRFAAAFDAGEWRLKPSEFSGRSLAADVRMPGATAATPLRLDGKVSFQQTGASTEGFDVALGRTRMRIAGDVRDLRNGTKGDIIISGANLDAIELRSWLVGPPAADPTAQQRAVLDYLRRCDVRLTAHLAHALFSGFTADTTFPVDELAIDASVNASRVETNIACAANDGWVRGSWKLPLDVSDPYFDLEYEARDLTAEKNTRPLVEAFFPGLTVRGRVTLLDQSHQQFISPPGATIYPTGTGEMILTDGTTVGRAAPLWVTKIFPGLNLASFDFTEMVNRFEKLADGTHNNHMTFYGSLYHLYVDGYSKANGDIRYEVGVDLLARLSPDLSRIGQGRVALFVKTGKIRNGVLEDEVVSYLTPVQVTQKILSNNILTVAYYAVKKQVTGL